MRHLAVSLVFALWALPVQAVGSTVCPPATGEDWLEGVSEEGDLLLRSRGAARLADLRLPESSPAREAALLWLGDHRGEVLVQGGAARDRWNPMVVRLVLVRGAGRLDVAHGLLENGLAVVDPATGDRSCVLATLALEVTARERGLGVWADDRYKPVLVGDIARLRERVGQFTLVEGRIRSVGERRQQTYLNFGSDWARDFTIIVPKRVWSLVQESGLGAAALRGRRIRARGVLEDRRGPSMTVTAMDAIEVLEGTEKKH
jgi:hypothetical protein